MMRRPALPPFVPMLLALVVALLVLAGWWALAGALPRSAFLMAVGLGCGLLLVGVGVAWYFRRRRQAPAAAAGAAMTVPVADPRAGSLRLGLAAAVEAIQRSKLGKQGGRAALYELPWYLVIGADGAGKTALIQHAGFSFPLHAQHRSPSGGADGCDWFLATEAVVLDVSGRYLAAPAGQPEWLDFWRQLRRCRPRQPLNGLVVTISVAELLGGDEQALRAHAARLRAGIDEIEDGLGQRLPVYLLVSKLDLLGAAASFVDATAGGVLGASLPRAQAVDADVAALVGDEFELLRLGLGRSCVERLGAHPGPAAEAAAFAFTTAFGMLGTPLRHFVDALFATNPYHARPLLRGFYFCAAHTATGSAGMTAGWLADRFELDGRSAATGTAGGSGAAYLRALFHEVILADRHFSTDRGGAAGGRRQLAGMLGGLAVLCLAVGALTWSFLGNHALLAELAEEREAVLGSGPQGGLHGRLQRLAGLQTQLERLGRYREAGRPWRLGLGLYQGHKVEAVLRAQYFEQLRAIMLDPVALQLEAELGGRPASSAVRPKTRRAPVAAAPVTAVPTEGGGLPIIPLGSGAGSMTSASEVAAASPRSALTPTVPSPARSGSRGENLEGGYNALKTYLMLGDQARMEPTHLSDQLPRHWRSWLLQNRGEASPQDIYPLAQRLAAFYIAERAAPDLPLIDNDAALIASARAGLRGALQQLPRHERIYRELKANANTRFEALSLTRILDGKDGDLLSGSAVVPGAFTWAAYEGYLRDALQAAGKGSVQVDDWVLDGAVGGGDGGADTERDRVALEALYRAEFVDAWAHFLQGIALVEQGDLPRIVDSLGRFGDPAGSPLLPLLRRAAQELGWLEGGAGATRADGEEVPASVLERARTLVGAQGERAKPGGRPQAVAPFAGLVALAGAPEVSPPLSGYFDRLARLRERLATLAANGNEAEPVRRLVRTTLDGGDAEFAAALSHVDVAMLEGMDIHSRNALRPLLVRPLVQAFAALMPVLERDLDLAWQREAYPQWRRLAEKYPFSDSPNEVPFADIAEFVRSGGALDRFITQRLDGLVTRRGNHLAARSWGNQGLRLSPGFVAGVEKLLEFGASLPREGEPGRFELQPVPTSGLSEITVEIDGQKLRYRNGPQPWQAFAWPGSGVAEGAAIRVVDFAGGAGVVANHAGRMGFVRLLGAAKVGRQDGGAAQLEWTTANGDAALPVRLNFRAVSGGNPLQLLALRNLALPERIVR